MSRAQKRRKKERHRLRDVKVGVITPSVPGRERMLAECLESVAAQTRPPDYHVVMVDHDLVGPGPLLNRMYWALDGFVDYYMPFGDDDLMHPNHLEEHLKRAREAEIVYSTPIHEGRPDQEFYDGPFDPQKLMNRQDAGIRGSFLFERDVFDKVGGFTDDVICDWKFLVSALVGHCRFVQVEEATWVYRFHGGNLSDVITRIHNGEEPGDMLCLARDYATP